jgi:anti-sigma regulatory factor (Ser/Thr protein kinase)
MSDDETLFSRPVSPDELGGAYGGVLDEIRDALKEFGVDVRRRRSIREIVMEYLLNIDIHAPPERGGDMSSTIELRKDDDAIVIEMKGPASRKDIERMTRLVNEYTGRDEDWLWGERERITRSGKPFDTVGSGLGLVTIAALSRRGPIAISSKLRGGVPYFTLTSRV